jgi:hypothetical protein
MEEESEIITAVETTAANKPDGFQLPVLLRQQKAANALVPTELSADKAYGSGANLEILDSKHITGNISLIEKFNRLGADLFTQDDFQYDKAHDTITCPAGCVSSHSKKDLAMTEDQRRKGIVFQFTRLQCSACELRSPLTSMAEKLNFPSASSKIRSSTILRARYWMSSGVSSLATPIKTTRPCPIFPIASPSTLT